MIGVLLAKFLARHDSQIANVIDVYGTDGCINRNMIILHFLAEKSDATHLLFVDADTVPSKNAIDLLLGMNVDIACGIVPVYKATKTFWNVMPVDESVAEGFMPKDSLTLSSKPLLVRKAGPACMLIKRNVLEKLSFPYFRNDCEKIGSVTNFLMRLPYTAGDFYFCEQIMKAGFEIWAQPKVRCGHYSTLNTLHINS